MYHVPQHKGTVHGVCASFVEVDTGFWCIMRNCHR